MELPKEKVTDTLRVAGRHVSVDAPFADGEDNSLLDVLVNPDSPNADRGLINESLSTEVDRALETLTDRERDIIKYLSLIHISPKPPRRTFDGRAAPGRR